MIKVFFTCPWENSKSLLNKLKKNTPGCKGIWKNVIGTLDIEHSDFIVILDDLNISLTRLGIHNFMRLVQNMNKLIYFQRENTAILNKANKSWFCQRILPVLKHKYSFENDFYYTFTTAHFLNKTYDELKNMEYPTKKNNISCVVSSKNFGKTYEDRKKFIKTYSNIYDNKIDIFGRGWDKNELGDNYKGELGSYHQQSETSTSKLDGLISYNYSICLENYPNEKVTSEKITDCLLCWCMPIYSGSVDTNKYYPSDAFHLIDIKEDNIYEKVYEMSSQDVTQKNIDAIREARNLILDTYNIWEQIYQISKNIKLFTINYNFNKSNVNEYINNNLVYVNNKYKFIYISPSKTASKTIKTYYNMNSNIRNKNDTILENKREPYNQDKFKNYLKIISIREPLTRCKSMQHYMNCNLSYIKKNLLNEIEFWPMSLYIKNTVKFLSNIDFFIRMEHLDNDIKQFNKIIDFKEITPISHLDKRNYKNTNIIVPKSMRPALKDHNDNINNEIKKIYEDDYVLLSNIKKYYNK